MIGAQKNRMKLSLFTIILASLLLFTGCKKEDDRSKIYSIGVFGGSQSSLPQGNPIKEKWAEIFDADITVCGVGGAGFGLWQEKNVLKQLQSNKIFDIYIFWCSTNDCGQPIENDSEENPNSQSGGLKLCVDYIKKTNPKATILLFTSLWIPNEWFKNRLPPVVDKQIEFCDKYKIPYLNQFNPNVLSTTDFWDDKVHFGPEAYWKLEVRQTEFLEKYIKMKSNED